MSAKAECLRTLGQPVWVRMVELPGGGPVAVRHLQATFTVEASNLSQRPAMPSCAATVTSTRAGAALCTVLLPALRGDRPDPVVNSLLGAVAMQIMHDAPLWDAHGRMLVCAVHSAVRLYRAGEQEDLLDLLRVVANRLYLMSARSGPITR